jgi:hypothetical protein
LLGDVGAAISPPDPFNFVEGEEMDNSGDSVRRELVPLTQ